MGGRDGWRPVNADTGARRYKDPAMLRPAGTRAAATRATRTDTAARGTRRSTAGKETGEGGERDGRP